MSEHGEEIRRVLREIADRRASGESPTLEEYAERFPRLREELAALFQMFQALDAPVRDRADSGSPALDDWAFHAWIETLVRRRAEDRDRHPLFGRRRPPAATSVEPAAEGGLGDTGLRVKHGALVHGFLQRLSPSHREVMRLHWFERLSAAEIAARLGHGTEAVRRTIVRALQTCRKLLAEGGWIGGNGRPRT